MNGKAALILRLISTVIGALAFLAGIIWFVASLNSSIQANRLEIQYIKQSVDGIQGRLEKIERDVFRIRLLLGDGDVAGLHSRVGLLNSSDGKQHP